MFIAFSNTSNGLSEFADFSVLMTFVFVAPRTHSCMHAKRDMPDNFSNSHSKRQSFFFKSHLLNVFSTCFINVFAYNLQESGEEGSEYEIIKCGKCFPGNYLNVIHERFFFAM